jgi:hypothetical protein
MLNKALAASNPERSNPVGLPSSFLANLCTAHTFIGG